MRPGDIINPRLVFAFTQSWQSFDYELRAAIKNGDGSIMGGNTAKFTTVEPGSVIPPMMTMGKDEAQALMDAMWNAGIRPSSGEGNVGQIGAMREHLEDMRRLVFKGEINPRLPVKTTKVNL